MVALTALELLAPARSLVIAPVRVCERVWRQEAAQWSHLQHVTFDLLRGPPQRRMEILRGGTAMITLVNYELIPWLVDALDGEWPFEAVVYDEVTKMKRAGTSRFRALRPHMLKSPIRFGLTGTPRGNSLLGMWGQAYAVHGPVLGPSASAFKGRHAYPVPGLEGVWRLNPGAEEDIRTEMAPYAHATPPDAGVSPATIIPIEVDLPPAALDHYHRLRSDLETTIDGHRVEAIEAGVNRNKRIQITSGAIYVEGDKRWVRVHDAKLDALMELVEELQGEQLLLFFRYRHELERISDLMPVATIRSLDLWLGGTRQVLAVHPASAGHGLNLHESGCAACCWFSLPDSFELWEQGNYRLPREGQERSVRSWVLSARGTVEEDVARDLRQHGRLQDELVAEAFGDG